MIIAYRYLITGVLYRAGECTVDIRRTPHRRRGRYPGAHGCGINIRVRRVHRISSEYDAQHLVFRHLSRADERGGGHRGRSVLSNEHPNGAKLRRSLRELLPPPFFFVMSILIFLSVLTR